ncbi:hypothetical protein [Dehalobacterium formicoaceticum]|uniref:hypothetical protein n=1 Tax=Dehalobacterium formicoaceticum TaxID=51515 RepID=UPI000B7E36AB|nr:hypothetical protein [Dehalobacterium formicoaceticum]
MVDLYSLLQETGMPVAYHHFKEKQTPPYLVYMFDESDNYEADNKTYHAINHYKVELYTVIKSPLIEGSVEALFDANEIIYEKLEAYIESEDLYQVFYDITI